MPCQDPDYGLIKKNAEQLYSRLRKAESELTIICHELEKTGYDFDLNPHLSHWWDDRKKAEFERLEALAKKQLEKKLCEELFQKPLSSLSDNDKKLLRHYNYI